MDQNDYVPVPNLVCRKYGVLLHVTATEKRAVTEFYVVHPKGNCPLESDWIRIDTQGRVLENISTGADWK